SNSPFSNAPEPVVEGYSATVTPLQPMALAFRADGRMLIADRRVARIFEIGPDGIVRAIAGGGNTFPAGTNSVSSRDINLNSITDLAITADETIYFIGGQTVMRLRDNVVSIVPEIGQAGAILADGNGLFVQGSIGTWNVFRWENGSIEG